MSAWLSAAPTPTPHAAGRAGGDDEYFVVSAVENFAMPILYRLNFACRACSFRSSFVKALLAAAFDF